LIIGPDLLPSFFSGLGRILPRGSGRIETGLLSGSGITFAHIQGLLWLILAAFGNDRRKTVDRIGDQERTEPEKGDFPEPEERRFHNANGKKSGRTVEASFQPLPIGSIHRGDRSCVDVRQIVGVQFSDSGLYFLVAIAGGLTAHFVFLVFL
jgi:hypothetical protein